MYKVLYVANTGDMYGGGQVSLFALVEGLHKDQFTPYVICPFEGNFVDEFKKIDIDPEIIPMETLRNFNIFGWINTVSKMVNLIKKEKINIVHSNGSRSAIYAGIASKIAGVPFICHMRIPYSDGLLDRFLAYLATKVIVVSRAVGRRFKWLEREKKEIIYNGVDIKKFNMELKGSGIRSDFGLDSKDIVIGMVSRISEEKGHEEMIKAMVEVVDAHPYVKVLVVGDGDEELRTHLKGLIEELNLTDHFIFTGHREDLENVYSVMDIFCLPSMYEGFNRSILEAMACGLPVIASKVGGNVEAVKDHISGLLIPPGKPEAISSAIMLLIDDNILMERMRMSGRWLVEEKFCIKHNIKKTEEVYLKVL